MWPFKSRKNTRTAAQEALKPLPSDVEAALTADLSTVLNNANKTPRDVWYGDAPVDAVLISPPSRSSNPEFHLTKAKEILNSLATERADLTEQLAKEHERHRQEVARLELAISNNDRTTAFYATAERMLGEPPAVDDLADDVKPPAVDDLAGLGRHEFLDKIEAVTPPPTRRQPRRKRHVMDDMTPLRE